MKISRMNLSSTTTLELLFSIILPIMYNCKSFAISQGQRAKHASNSHKFLSYLNFASFVGNSVYNNPLSEIVWECRVHKTHVLFRTFPVFFFYVLRLSCTTSLLGAQRRLVYSDHNVTVCT